MSRFTFNHGICLFYNFYETLISVSFDGIKRLNFSEKRYVDLKYIVSSKIVINRYVNEKSKRKSHKGFFINQIGYIYPLSVMEIPFYYRLNLWDLIIKKFILCVPLCVYTIVKLLDGNNPFQLTEIKVTFVGSLLSEKSVTSFLYYRVLVKM